MRVVLDTNVVVSGLLFGGLPRQILDYQQAKRCRFLTSDWLCTELQRILNYEKFGRKLARLGRTAEQLVDFYRDFAERIDVSGVDLPDVARDPDDNHVLACAEAGQAWLVVSGDSDLLALGEYKGIRIITVADFAALMEATGEG